MRRFLLGLLKVVVGLALGLVVAELVFAARAAEAFAHVNFYEADPVLGTRLRPHAHMKIAFGGNPVTSLRTNDRGYRGDKWPAPTPRDVLVVGDSQVFGLGVAEDATFSKRLEKEMPGWHVLNAGVPTYGPREYTTLVERIVAERKPEAVVYVLNLANDLFEAPRPNTERHAVWDGWAVRKETAPDRVQQFPGRAWLMSQSHAMYALRRLWHASELEAAVFASEGAWHDVVGASQRTDVPAVPKQSELDEAHDRRASLTRSLDGIEYRIYDRFSKGVDKDERYRAEAKRLSGYRGNPRDILFQHFAEDSRPVNATAYQLMAAALALGKNTGGLEAFAERVGDPDLLANLRRRKALREELAQVTGTLTTTTTPEPQALDTLLARTKRACDAVGARLLVVALPLDVQVSPVEWKKYGHAPIDMSATAVLGQDVVRRAELQGALAIDATAALAAAEPGAFLLGDLHMSAKGHGALARALAVSLREPRPYQFRLPPGRSVLPTNNEWAAAGDMGDTGDRCRLSRVREWWLASCSNRDGDGIGDDVIGVALQRGGHGEAIARRDSESYSSRLALMLPVLPGDDVEAVFSWHFRKRTLRSRTLADGTTVLEFAQAALEQGKPGVHPDVLEVERAWRSAANFVGRVCASGHEDENEDCQLLHYKPCSQGQLAFGAIRRCVPRCSPDAPCKRGRCALWNGERGCIEP